MNPSEIEQLIENGMPNANVRVMSDDNTHYAAIIVSDAFEGQRRLKRHQMVYQCLGTLMGNEIHAMSIQAHTVAEWAQLQVQD